MAAISGRAVQRSRRPNGPAPAGVLRRSVFIETAGATVLIAVTAVLGNANPSREARAEAAAARRSGMPAMMAGSPAGPIRRSVGYDTGGANGSGPAMVTLDPGSTGRNSTMVVITDKERRINLPELDVSLELPGRGVGPLAVTVRRVGLGNYRAADVAIPLPGNWQINLTVRTSDIDETTVTTTVPLR